MKTEPTSTLAAVAPATTCSACSEIPVSGTTETQARQIKGNSYRVYYGGEGSPFTDRKDLAMARASACGHDHAVIHHLRPFSQPDDAPEWWAITVGGGYGTFLTRGTKSEAEEVRRNKARWEGATAKKRLATAAEILENAIGEARADSASPPHQKGN